MEEVQQSKALRHPATGEVEDGWFMLVLFAILQSKTIGENEPLEHFVIESMFES